MCLEIYTRFLNSFLNCEFSFFYMITNGNYQMRYFLPTSECWVGAGESAHRLKLTSSFNTSRFKSFNPSPWFLTQLHQSAWNILSHYQKLQHMVFKYTKNQTYFKKLWLGLSNFLLSHNPTFSFYRILNSISSII